MCLDNGTDRHCWDEIPTFMRAATILGLRSSSDRSVIVRWLKRLDVLLPRVAGRRVVVVDFVVVRSVNYALTFCTHIFSAQALEDTSIGLVVVSFNLLTPRSWRKECPAPMCDETTMTMLAIC